MHIVMAVNPNAAFGRNRSVHERLAERLIHDRHTVQVLIRETYEQLQADCAQAVRSADALVVVGGDGMVSLGVNALAGTNVPMAVLPTGTGNDFARALGMPIQNIELAIAEVISAMQRQPVSVDTVSMQSVDGSSDIKGFGRYVGVLSAGFDAIVNERANTLRRPRGPSRYILALLLELIRLRPRKYRITVDERSFEVEAVLVAVANNVSLGGGMMIVPHAQLQDHRLDLIVARTMSRMQLLRVFPKVFSGRHVDHPMCDFYEGATVTLHTDDVVAYADGERVAPLPLKLTVNPDALRVYAADGSGLA